jgi:hypothetical protein
MKTIRPINKTPHINENRNKEIVFYDPNAVNTNNNPKKNPKQTVTPLAK